MMRVSIRTLKRGDRLERMLLLFLVVLAVTASVTLSMAAGQEVALRSGVVRPDAAAAAPALKPTASATAASVSDPIMIVLDTGRAAITKPVADMTPKTVTTTLASTSPVASMNETGFPLV